MKIQIKASLYFLVLAALILSACGPALKSAGSDIVSDSSAANMADSQVGVIDQNAEEPAGAGSQITTDNGGQVGAVEVEQQASVLEEKPPLGFAPGAAELHASDPNSLDFTSGELHLVELFAFW